MADEPSKPRIVIFSGPRATIQNSAPLVTSADTPPEEGYDLLRSQLLAAPVTVYIEAFTAHPMEKDVVELYGPPDGWIDPATGEFFEQPSATATRPAYKRTLRPEDGPFLLPYAARQADGQPWTSTYTSDPATPGGARQVFYPDASRIVTEIDRFGLDGGGRNNILHSMADFDFVRPAPSAGYTKGQAERERTDLGTGDIAPEIPGEDFFSYAPVRREPPLPVLARLTNTVARTMATGAYTGAIWLEGSPTNEETIYWLSLLVGTDVPLVGNSSQSGHGTLANDGDHNLVQSVNYITSGVWRDAAGKDRVGAVMIQNGQIFTARDVHKADARPGGYVAHGGHGGIIGNTVW
ncbi:MAG: asparaginase, partial [Actinobacteria bacterium]|nr:asparaginase [Actinomycetota bacterium]